MNTQNIFNAWYFLQTQQTLYKVPNSPITQNLIKLSNKEMFKLFAGLITFSFGLATLYDVSTSFRDRTISTAPKPTRWENTIIYASQASLILGAATSYIGISLISKIAKHLISQEQLQRAFGPSTIFAVNPWHPRHVASLTSAALALPMLIHSIYKRIQPISYNKLRLATLVYLSICRPTLHIGNLLFKHLIGR